MSSCRSCPSKFFSFCCVVAFITFILSFFRIIRNSSAVRPMSLSKTLFIKISSIRVSSAIDFLVSSFSVTIPSTPFLVKNALYSGLLLVGVQKSYGFILSDNCDNVKKSVKILTVMVKNKASCPTFGRTPLKLKISTSFNIIFTIQALFLSD